MKEPVSEKRRLIPHEFCVTFKTLFRGLEVHRVLGERVLVDEVEPFTELDATQQRLAEMGLEFKAPEVFYDAHGNKKVAEKPRACTGIVIQVGDGIGGDDKASGLVEGAAVCFGAYAGTEYYIGGAKFRILDISEILAVLRATEGHELTEVIAPVKASKP